MIPEYLRYELKTHSAQELIDAYEAAGEHLQAAPECLGYELSQCVGCGRHIHLCASFGARRDDHLQGFRKGPHFPPFLELIRPFIGEMVEMRHYEPTAVNWRRT